MSTLKDRLADERKKLNWTQEDLAEKCGVSRAVIAKIECGTTVQPSYRHMTAIAASLNVDPGYLLFGAGNAGLSSNAVAAAKIIQSLPSDKQDALMKIIESMK
jgi:transcriptional regulator with XRE-family HTH domain